MLEVLYMYLRLPVVASSSSLFLLNIPPLRKNLRIVRSDEVNVLLFRRYIMYFILFSQKIAERATLHMTTLFSSTRAECEKNGEKKRKKTGNKHVRNLTVF